MGERQTKGILTPTHPHAEIYLFLKSSRKCNILPAKSASCIFLLHCRTDELNEYQKRYESSQEMVEVVALYQKWMVIEEKKRGRQIEGGMAPTRVKRRSKKRCVERR